MQQQATGVSRVVKLPGGSQRRLTDVLFRGLTLLLVLVVLATILGIVIILINGSLPTVQQFGFSFLTNQAFDPVHNVYGVAPAIYGTLVTSVFAIIFAVPIGVGAAIFLTDYCPRLLRIPLAFIAELLAAVPSIIFGLWGFLTLSPWLGTRGEPWLQQHLGFLPFFQGAYHGLGLLAAGLVLIIMILPLIISVSREVMLNVPRAQREALLALGATRWEVIRYAVLPFASVGITGGAILALGRALGETMAVTLVIGNQTSQPSLHLFDTGYTLSSLIANTFGEATPGLFISSLLEAGLIVFIITLITNIFARLLIARMGRAGRRRAS